jgi:hypothetical protein
VIWNRHGIRLLFLSVGSLGKFDFQTLLLTVRSWAFAALTEHGPNSHSSPFPPRVMQFVSGIGLLAVATLVVDVIAVRVRRPLLLFFVAARLTRSIIPWSHLS